MPSLVILSESKNLCILLRVNYAKDLALALPLKGKLCPKMRELRLFASLRVTGSRAFSAGLLA